MVNDLRRRIKTSDILELGSSYKKFPEPFLQKIGTSGFNIS